MFVSCARGICSNDESDPIRQYLKPLLELLAKSYLDIVRSQTGEGKEFFGLRDFYRFELYGTYITWV